MGMLNENELASVATPDKSDWIPEQDEILGDYIEEIKTPKQEQPRPEIPDDSEIIEPEPERRAPSRYEQKRTNLTAKFAITTLDKLVASLVAVYAHAEDVDEFKAEPQDIDELSEQWAVYFTDENLDLPPWVFALITTGMVLMKKVKAAGMVRKLNIERKKHKAEIAKQQADNELLKIRIQKLEAEKMAIDLEKQLEDLKPVTH